MTITVRSCFRLAVATALTSLALGCITKASGNEEKRPPADPPGSKPIETLQAPTVETTVAEATLANAGAGWDPGPGLVDCNSRRTAWIATTPTGSDGACGEFLVSWCCSEGQIYPTFPSAREALEVAFAAVKEHGLKLYNCSGVDGSTTFHWAMRDGQAMRYASVIVAGAEEKPQSPPWICDRIKAEDLGL